MEYVLYTRAEEDIWEHKPGYGFPYASDGLDKQILLEKVLPLLSCVKTINDGQCLFAIIPSLDNHLSVINGFGTTDGNRRTPFVHAYLMTPRQREAALTARNEFFCRPFEEDLFLNSYAGNPQMAEKLLKKIPKPTETAKITDFLSPGIVNIGITKKLLESIITALFYVSCREKKQVFFIQKEFAGSRLIKYGKNLLALLYSLLPISEVFKLGVVITDTSVLETASNVMNCKWYHSLPEGEHTLFPGANLYVLNRLPNKISAGSVVFYNNETGNTNPDYSDFKFIKTITNAIDDRTSLHKTYGKIEEVIAKAANIAPPDLQDMEFWEIALNANKLTFIDWLKNMKRSEFSYFLDILYEFAIGYDEALKKRAEELYSLIVVFISDYEDKIFYTMENSKAQKTVVRIVSKIQKISKVFSGVQKNQSLINLIENNKDGKLLT